MLNKLQAENLYYDRRKDLRLIPELAVNPLGNRIIEAFFVTTDE